MRVVKIFLMLISIICVCFSLFAMSITFSADKTTEWYRYGFGLFVFIIAMLNFFYHLKSLAYYGKEVIINKNFSVVLRIASLVFSCFFLWLTSDVFLYLVEESEIREFQYYIFEAILCVVFIFISIASILELVTFHKKLKTT